MINHSKPFKRDLHLKLSSIAAVACLSAALLPIGCSEEPQQAAAPPPAPYVPPPPPPPAVKSIEQLMAELSIDPRIVLPEERAPGTTEARVAVLEFFDAFARGDDQSISKMLSTADRQELDMLVRTGEWKGVTGSIKRIDIQTGQSPAGDPAALAVIEVAKPAGTDYQPQLWYYEPKDDGYNFVAVATPPGIMEKLSGDDWIEAWHRILAEDLALADKPDEAIIEPKVENDNGGNSGEASAGDSPGGASPGGGPGMPGKNKRPKTPYQPPHP